MSTKWYTVVVPPYVTAFLECEPLPCCTVSVVHQLSILVAYTAGIVVGETIERNNISDIYGLLRASDYRHQSSAYQLLPDRQSSRVPPFVSQQLHPRLNQVNGVNKHPRGHPTRTSHHEVSVRRQFLRGLRQEQIRGPQNWANEEMTFVLQHVRALRGTLVLSVVRSVFHSHADIFSRWPRLEGVVGWHISPTRLVEFSYQDICRVREGRGVQHQWRPLLIYKVTSPW